MKKVFAFLLCIFLLGALIPSALGSNMDASSSEKVSTAAHIHQMSTAWVFDNEKHWHRCQVTGCTYVEDLETHQFDSGCDISCDLCGYIRFEITHNFSEDWVSNADGHWQKCKDCDAVSVIQSHVAGSSATETAPQLCTICGYEISPALGAEGSSTTIAPADSQTPSFLRVIIGSVGGILAVIMIILIISILGIAIIGGIVAGILIARKKKKTKK